MIDQKKQSKVFQIIKNDKAQEDHLFKKLASAKDPIPWLKPLKDKGYFDPKKYPIPQENPSQKGFFTISHWNILGYLENVARYNLANPSEDVIQLLISIIDPIIQYRMKSREQIDNYYADWIIFKIIFMLPIPLITKHHFLFIKSSLNSRWDSTLISAEIGISALPYLIGKKAKKLILQLIDLLLEYKITDKKRRDKYISLVQPYWFYGALHHHKKAIAKICGGSAADIALNKIKTIIQEDPDQFDNMWIPTIEDHEQTRFTDRYEYQLVLFIRDILEQSNSIQIREKISRLINEKHPIFKRIAIHNINFHYETLKDIFWNWKENPLDEKHLKHEIYELIRSHCNSLSVKQIQTVINWIESKKYFIPEQIKGDPARIEKLLAYQKKEWLMSLIETENSEVQSLYEKYNKINPRKPEHPGLDHWIGVSVGYKSPIKLTELCSMSNKKIANYLINFKEKQGWNEPDMEGLSDAFRKCISDNPKKFAEDIQPFLNTQRIYQYELFRGLSKAWKEGKDFSWDKILNFIKQIIEPLAFWEEQYERKGYNYRNWLISQISELIEEGTKDDKHAFEPNLFPQAETLLLHLVKKTKSDLHDTDDIVTAVLNSSKGKIFSAIISYSLRYGRVYKNQADERWPIAIKKDFNTRLDRAIEPSLEFSLTLGQCLANLFWLDNQWATDQINRILPLNLEKHWKAGFTGYLFFTSQIFKNVYFCLRTNGHYTRALKTNFNKNHISDRLVQHICIGYIEDWEELNDNKSLISQLLRKQDVKQLKEILRFFWSQRDKITKKIKLKVKPCWGKLVEIALQNEQKKEYQILLSDLSKWISLVDIIDDQIFQWLKLSIKYFQVHNHTSLFIEYLLEHVLKAPEKVGKLYLEMLNSNIYPDYKKESIQEIIDVLYQSDHRKIADRICNLYLSNGMDLLRDIYEKNRQDQKVATKK